MPRPKKPRFVTGYPMSTAFRPEGMPVSGEITLAVEGMEAIRLSDFECLDQAAAADFMGVSRQTYGRVLAQARRTIAEALLTGKVLRIGGGHWEVRGGGRRQARRGRRKSGF